MKKPLLLVALFLSIGQMIAQNNSIWQRADVNKTSTLSRVRPNVNDEGELYFTVDLNTLRQNLSAINDRSANNTSVEVEFPNMNGEVETFRVMENSNFDAELQAQFPEIRAYKGQGITDKAATINFSVSPQGVQTMLFRPGNSMEFIEAYDKAATTYVVFNSTNRNKSKIPFNCSTVDEPLVLDLMENTNRASNHISKTMRLALSCVAEYSTYFGATSAAQVGLVLAAYNNTMTRVNGIMEKDLALHLNIIASSTSVIYYNAGTDPYSAAAAGSGGAWNAELQATLNSVITAANYDIGHLFGASGGGGNAGCIGCVCGTLKGSAFTSPGDGIPQGDNFDIDYVIHEMGHQLGGNHSFTHGYEGSVAQVEPGSGSSIMGYAGITSYDVAAHSDALFCYKNILQIQNNLNVKTCPVSTVMTANSTPTVSAGTDYTIPKATPYVLTGIANDADPNDVLTYNWEENDLGNSVNVNALSRVSSTKTAGPNFRIFKPSQTPTRYFPQMGRIMASTNGVTGLVVTTSNNTYWESLFNGTANRNFNFTFTARDNHVGTDYGQTATDAMVLTVDVTKGPLTVTSQAVTGIVYDGGTSVPVTWAVNSTDLLAGAQDVDILISTNASTALETLTTPAVNPTTWTTIASGVPNNGSAMVTLPNPATQKTACRFMVKAAGNVFFAANFRNFTINNNPALAIQDFGLDNFTLYPNPNQGSFNIKFDSNTSNTINISVFDIRGREVYANSYSNTGMIDQNIKLNSVEAGVYLVKVVDGDRKVVKRIVVE